MERTEINLVILSPSSEVNKLTFTSLPTSTTIAELREKIATAVVTHPEPGRQRLIYRGHALLDGKRTLKDIFTQEIINSSDALSLHLVLPPQNTAHPGPSSSPQAAEHAHRTSPHAQQQGPRIETHGNRAPTHFPVDPVHAQHGHGHGLLPNGQFPPQLQQAFAQFQAVNQQLAAQLAAVGTNPGLSTSGSQQGQAPSLQQTNFINPMLQNILAAQQQQLQQQQQARATNGPPGFGLAPQPGTQASQASAPNSQQETNPTSSQFRSSSPGDANTVIREDHGPNGERWQMVIQSGQVNMSPNNNPHTQGDPPFGNSIRTSPAPPNRTGQAQLPSTGLFNFQSNLSAMEAATLGGNPLPQAVFEQARQMLSGISELPHELRSSLSSRLDSVARRAHHLRENVTSHLSRAAQERALSQRATQGADSSAVYVLSSPSGPQALLVSPTGSYSAPWHLPSVGLIPHTFVHHHPTGATLNQAANLNNTADGRMPHVDVEQVIPAQPAAPRQMNAGPAAQVQQQQQVNQARDLMRVLLPLGGHLWLLIRLLGFVYFFTAGAGWRRTILLGLVACLVFVAQIGIFRPIIQAIWDPIRRHAEGLVPLAGNERPHAAAAGGGDGASDAQPVDRDPTPEEAAERLLREREGQDVNLLRQSMRRVERAIALFVASLVPGVGERHIAAREAAEAARQVEVRQRADQMRREAEERQRTEETAAELNEHNATISGEGDQSTATAEPEQAAQQPLIEI